MSLRNVHPSSVSSDQEQDSTVTMTRAPVEGHAPKPPPPPAGGLSRRRTSQVIPFNQSFTEGGDPVTSKIVAPPQPDKAKEEENNDDGDSFDGIVMNKGIVTSSGAVSSRGGESKRGVITLQQLQMLVKQQKGGNSVRGNLLLDWWQFMKTKHKILRIFYDTDTIFTRPERIMVIGIFFLFTMAVNCFLFIFQGNANSGKNGWEIFVNQLQ
jgi:hypothetical protein